MPMLKYSLGVHTCNNSVLWGKIVLQAMSDPGGLGMSLAEIFIFIEADSSTTWITFSSLVDNSA